MLRTNLLLTTALLFVVSASCVAAQPAMTAASRMQKIVANPDTNNEFIRTYSCGNGYFSVSGHASEASFQQSSNWTHVAVHIVGNGRTVHQILVHEGYHSYYRHHSYNNFSAGIYSNTQSGLPGKLIAGGQGKARPDCGPVTISFSPTRLSRKKIYWIEETAGPYAKYSSHNDVYWQLAPNSKQAAYTQKHHWMHSTRSSSGSTTPWTALKGAPYFRLK